MYKAPSRIFSNTTGIKVYHDWGLSNHAGLQKRMLPYGNVGDGWDIDLVDEILRNQYWVDGLVTTEFQRYHAAMGMISQFNREDIEYFIQVPFEKRDRDHLQNIEALECSLNTRMYWVPSPSTVKHIALQIQDRYS